MLLDFTALEKINDVKTIVLDMQKEWGGEIKLKAFGLQEQLEFEKCKSKIVDDGDIVLLMLRMCIVDDDNHLVFNKENIDVLATKNSKHLFKVFNACLDLNALNASSVEDNAKN